MDFVIEPAYHRLDSIRELFTEYTEALGLDLAFQGFAEELAALPGKYAGPDGRLYLASLDGEAAGCIALRRFDAECCEMKRLYVRDKFRGRSLARRLAGLVIADARAAGYRYMLLDTMRSMRAAGSLYASLGFVEVEPYYHNPFDAVFYRLDLAGTSTGSQSKSARQVSLSGQSGQRS
ncbi:GNAT family N-acetyltransferase [Desulfovibrio sp. OttesenSCG-928-C06]|nr:GNAT family N-acetyltransferase [Desulfovibrio sp. OttesenSCG-928-C06]